MRITFKLFATLTDLNYRGDVAIEVEDRAYESSESDVLTSIRQSKRYLEPFIR